MASSEPLNLLFIAGKFHIDVLNLDSGDVLFNVASSSEIAAIAY